MRPADHYTLITADSHAGGSHAQYREYLEQQFLDDFDAWRGKYKNPFRDLRDTSERVRNWDSERRWSDMESDGVVAEVLFPNTIPPFFPSFVLFAPPPRDGDEYRHRLAGIRAHNRWLADFVAECPERRAGIGQIFVNDLDDAIEDARWIKEHGLRGGVLLPNFAPDSHLAEAVLRRVVRSAVGGARGSGHPGQPPRRDRFAGLRRSPRDGGSGAARRGKFLLPAAAGPSPARRRVRAVSRV